MSTEIDWSKAPEGATHWGPETHSHRACWYMQSAGGWLFSLADQGLGWLEKDHIEPYRLNQLVARPAEPWSGEGLPPVGTVCEYQRPGDIWQKVIILAHHNGHAWATGDDGKHCFTVPPHGNFRLIKTPEQIAAEERERAIEEIASLIGRGTFSEDAASIYDAGYRKIEGGAE